VRRYLALFEAGLDFFLVLCDGGGLLFHRLAFATVLKFNDSTGAPLGEGLERRLLARRCVRHILRALLLLYLFRVGLSEHSVPQRRTDTHCLRLWRPFRFRRLHFRRRL
jgi:hypothetical protein